MFVPLAEAVKLAVAPVAVAAGSTGTLSVKGAVSVTVQVKLVVAAFSPSLTATTTL